MTVTAGGLCSFLSFQDRRTVDGNVTKEENEDEEENEDNMEDIVEEDEDKDAEEGEEEEKRDNAENVYFNEYKRRRSKSNFDYKVNLLKQLFED